MGDQKSLAELAWGRTSLILKNIYQKNLYKILKSVVTYLKLSIVMGAQTSLPAIITSV